MDRLYERFRSVKAVVKEKAFTIKEKVYFYVIQRAAPALAARFKKLVSFLRHAKVYTYKIEEQRGRSKETLFYAPERQAKAFQKLLIARRKRGI